MRVAAPWSIWGVCTGIALAAIAGPAAARDAGQSSPPIPGATGTIALEGSVDSIYDAAGTIVVLGSDGVRRTFKVTKDLLTHGGKPQPMNDWLAGLRPGTAVVAHYSGTGENATLQELDRVGDDGMTVSEGVVRSIDRRKQEITVRFADGRTEKLKLTLRAAQAGQDLGDGSRGQTIVVYYTDRDGTKEAHYFKKK
jgi:hypothetical protein